MRYRYIVVWHWGKPNDDDVYIEGIFDSKTDAQLYLSKIRESHSNSTVFSILSIPIE